MIVKTGCGTDGSICGTSSAADQIVTIRKFSHLQIGRGPQHGSSQLVGWALIALRSHRRALPLVFWLLGSLHTFLFWLLLVDILCLKECQMYLHIVQVSTRPTLAAELPGHAWWLGLASAASGDSQYGKIKSKLSNEDVQIVQVHP